MGKARVCAVFGCTPAKNSNLKYHKFPPNANLAKVWLHKCRRLDKVNITTAVICQRHFSAAQKLRNLKVELLGCEIPQNARNLKEDAIPDQLLPLPKPQDVGLHVQCKDSRRESTAERRELKRMIPSILSSGTKSMKKSKRKVGPSTSKCSEEVDPSILTRKRKLSQHISFHQLPESAKEVMDSDPFEFIDVMKHCSDYDMLEKERTKVKVEQCNDNEKLEEEGMKVEIEDYSDEKLETMIKVKVEQCNDNEKLEEEGMKVKVEQCNDNEKLEEEGMKVKIEDCSDEKLEEERMKVKVEDFSDEDVIVKVEHNIDEDDKNERANKFVSDKNKNLYGTGWGPPSPDIKLDEPEPNPNYNDTDNWLKGAPAKLYDESNSAWTPSLELGHTKTTRSSTQKSAGRYQHGAMRRKHTAHINTTKILLELSISTDDDLVEEIPEQVEAVSEQVNNSSARESSVAADVERHSIPSTSNGTQTKLTMEQIRVLHDQLNLVMAEKVALEKKLHRITINEEYFVGDDERVSYYTGLEGYHHMMTLYSYIQKDVFVNDNSALTGFQQMILTLMRLRLNLSVQDIAYRFGVSDATISKIFLKLLDILHRKIKNKIKWPCRHELMVTMPICLKAVYGTKVAVIIDCFEVFLDPLSSLLSQAQTGSSSKHHNTIKFLIGSTPQGGVSFISKAWGGRTRDKYIIEHCGFLSHISPGDVILADQGFDITESVALLQATVEVPAFMEGKEQMSDVDDLKARNITNLQIHVERVIGLVYKRYTILGGPLPVDYAMKVDENRMSTVDKIAAVCCALTNLCPSVINVG